MLERGNNWVIKIEILDYGEKGIKDTYLNCLRKKGRK